MFKLLTLNVGWMKQIISVTELAILQLSRLIISKLLLAVSGKIGPKHNKYAQAAFPISVIK